MRISKNFTLDEFIVSADHPTLLEDITFTRAEAERTRQLGLYILQPLRDYLDNPVTILSGKRDLALNAEVGGHVNSDHLYKPSRKSIACDFTCENLKSAWFWLLDRKEYFKMAMLYESRHFIHLSGLDDSPIRGKVLTKL